MGNNDSGQQFYSALQAKAMSAVKDILKSDIYPIQYPSQGDFMWNYQNANQVFKEYPGLLDFYNNNDEKLYDFK